MVLLLKVAALLALLGSEPVTSVPIAAQDAGVNAAAAFQDVCLATRGSGIDGVIAAIQHRPGITELQSFPAFSGGKPMRVFSDGSLEFLVRPDKRGRYGCFVAVKSVAPEVSEAIKAALDGLPQWRIKPFKLSKKVYFEWAMPGTKDEIRLTPSSDIGAVLINLEVNS